MGRADKGLLGSYLAPDFVTEGRSLILYGKAGRGKTHLAVAIGYRAIQNGFETLCTTAAELVEELSNASKKGHLQESLLTFTRPHVLVVDEVGYLTYGPDAANVLFHVVNDRHLRKRPMIFTTNKPLSEWGKVLHDEDLAAAILDRVLERGRFVHLDGPSGRTRHLNLEQVLPSKAGRLRISGINGSEFPEPTTRTLREMWVKIRAFPFPNHDSSIRRAQFFPVIHNIVTRIHRVSTGESTFALVVYFRFDNVSKACSRSNLSQSSEM